MLRSLSFLLIALPFLARAATGGAPVTLSHAGYLLDGADAPVEGSLSLSFRLYPEPSGVAPAEFAATCAGVPVKAGYYAVVLGEAPCVGTGGTGDATLDTSDLPTDEDRWLEVQVGAVTVAPRLLLGRAPVAHHALDADRLGGQLPSAFAPAVHGHDIAAVAGLQAALDARLTAELDPTIGAITDGKWCTAQGGQITCTSDEPAGTASQATAGASTPVACGPATIGYLHFDPSSSSLKVCNGAVYSTLGTVTPPAGAPTGFGAIAGNTSIATSWSAAANATSYEVLYQPGTTLDGSAIVVPAAGTSHTITGLTNGQVYTVAVRSVQASWRSAASSSVQATPTPLWNCTSAPSHAGCVSSSTYASCLAIRNDPLFDPADGLYFIDPDLGSPNPPFQVWCDMLTDTGGWTTIARYRYVDGPNTLSGQYAKTGGVWRSNVGLASMGTGGSFFHDLAKFTTPGLLTSSSTFAIRSGAKLVKFNNFSRVEPPVYDSSPHHTRYGSVLLAGTTYNIVSACYDGCCGSHTYEWDPPIVVANYAGNSADLGNTTTNSPAYGWADPGCSNGGYETVPAWGMAAGQSTDPSKQFSEDLVFMFR